MKNAEMTETLIRAIQNCAEDYIRSTDESAGYEYLTTVLKLSDADIDAIGLGYLIPDPEEDPAAEPLKEYEFIVWEKLAQRIVIPADSEADAIEILERDYLEPGIDICDMEVVDSSWNLMNPD